MSVMSNNTSVLAEQLLPNLKSIAYDGRLRGVWRLMRGFRTAYLSAGVSLGLATAARTGSLLVIRYFVDQYLAPNGHAMALWLIVIGFVALAAIQGGFTFVSGALAAHTAEGITQRLRNYLLDHLQHLPFAYYDDMQTGEMVQRVTSDVDAVRRFFAAQAIESSRILYLFVINFAAIWLLDKQLAVISVLVIPVILGLSVFFFRLVSKAYEAYQEQDAILTTALQENLSGVRVVKAFARQSYEQDKFETVNWTKYRRGKQLFVLHSLYWPISDILCGVQMLAGYTAGAIMAINGDISIGTYMAYAGMLLLVIWPMRNLGRSVVEMSRGLVSFERVAEIIRADREVMDETDFHPPKRLHGELVFENVSFAYGRHTPAAEQFATAGTEQNVAGSTNQALGGGTAHAHAVALQGISFRVKPGQRVALLGATGAGKTTLVNLLPRFYDYSDGRILLDGVELKHYSRGYLRQHIGIVEQEPFLFSRTVRENIVYSVGHDVTQHDIEAAARAAAIHDVIMTKLPHGYDTLVGERGTTLSGGQKQRVAIARTLLKDPRILILDDSTSAVDTETEGLIRHALDKLMENRTTFVIAHRIQSLMSADLILVLNRGRIVQAGTHNELIGQDGIYRRIYAAQTRIEDELQKELSGVEPA